MWLFRRNGSWEEEQMEKLLPTFTRVAVRRLILTFVGVKVVAPVRFMRTSVLDSYALFAFHVLCTIVASHKRYILSVHLAVFRALLFFIETQFRLHRSYNKQEC